MWFSKLLCFNRTVGLGYIVVILRFQEIRCVIFTAPRFFKMFSCFLFLCALRRAIFRCLIPNSTAQSKKFVCNSLTILFFSTFPAKKNNRSSVRLENPSPYVPFICWYRWERFEWLPSQHLKRRAANFSRFIPNWFINSLWIFCMRAVKLNESKLLLFFLAHWMLKLTWMNLFT